VAAAFWEVAPVAPVARRASPVAPPETVPRAEALGAEAEDSDQEAEDSDREAEDSEAARRGAEETAEIVAAVEAGWGE
jgi:hypothetical protein